MNTETKIRERGGKNSGLSVIFNLSKVALTVFISVLIIVALVKTGSLTPPGTPASTMYNLSTIYSFLQNLNVGSEPRAISAETSGISNIGTAATYCSNLSAPAVYAMDGNTTTTYTDWRLPTAEELGVFVGISGATGDYLWTSTVYQPGLPTTGADADGYIIVNLSNGNWTSNARVTGPEYVRCVR